MADGFLLVDKPTGWTSHDVVAKVRGVLGLKKVGHAGTLDPLATGLLVLGVGRATRLLRFVQDGRKGYEARVAFGIATDTLDADGAILDREPMDFDLAELERVAAGFVGVIDQVPPMVSAVKVGGRRLYELAREGVEVERESRRVEIDTITILDLTPGPYPEATLQVTCGSGTYIRTLADDIARGLGGRAHLTALRRTSIGPHHVDAAIGPAELSESEDPWRHVMPMAAGLSDMARVDVDAATAQAVGNGMVFTSSALDFDSGLARIVDPDGSLVAVYSSDGVRARPEVVVG